MLNSIMNYDRLISKVLFLGYDIAESNKSCLSLEIHFIVSASLFQIHEVKEPAFLKRPDSEYLRLWRPWDFCWNCLVAAKEEAATDNM